MTYDEYKKSQKISEKEESCKLTAKCDNRFSHRVSLALYCLRALFFHQGGCKTQQSASSLTPFTFMENPKRFCSYHSIAPTP